MSCLDENGIDTAAIDTNYEKVIETLTVSYNDLKVEQEKVNNLYAFRDLYFETHSLEDAARKTADVEQELENTVRVLNENQESATHSNRARYYYLKGRALNVLPKYNKESEELLSKAVKLDPKLVDAWNELGECCWKDDNLKEAEDCFTAALNYEKNKISLRSLSMIARQKSYKNQETKLQFVEKGLNLAKEAVQVDPQDGLSWIVLGNAHLSSFFGMSQSPKTLKQCLSAYAQAEKDVVAKSNPDLHYNKAITLQYEEEYELALDSFNMASLYEPGWEAPKMKIKLLMKYLGDITEFVASSGKMKAKKLQQTIQSIDSKHLGPYIGGSYTSPGGQTAKLDEVALVDLKSGLNEEKVILGKVVCSVYNEDRVPFTFCLVDKSGTCVAITVFNIAESRGVIIGDSVAVPEPYVTDVDFKYKDKKFKFRLIRVETPRVMVVNGKKLGKETQAKVQMSVMKKFT